MARFITFFVVVALVSSAFGLFVNKEVFNAVFAARVFFTACLTTLLYFVIVRRSKRR